MAKITDTKQKAAFITAIVSFCIGWGLTIWGFILPPKGEVASSTLTILGEAMVYTASVLGVTLYFQNQMAKFRHDARRYMDGHRDTMEEMDDGDSQE